jgi:hypothetical protein
MLDIFKALSSIAGKKKGWLLRGGLTIVVIGVISVIVFLKPWSETPRVRKAKALVQIIEDAKTAHSNESDEDASYELILSCSLRSSVNTQRHVLRLLREIMNIERKSIGEIVAAKIVRRSSFDEVLVVAVDDSGYASGARVNVFVLYVHDDGIPSLYYPDLMVLQDQEGLDVDTRRLGDYVLVFAEPPSSDKKQVEVDVRYVPEGGT